jgi:MiaB/RimO family radical SAM methylthiotransferase
MNNNSGHNEMIGLNKRVFILTNGCPENRIDSSRIQEFFKQNNFKISNRIECADIIIFNTCALTQDCEEASIKIIEEIKKISKPSAKLIVCGCLAKINSKRLRSVYQGPIFGSDELEELDKIFKPWKKSEYIYANYLIRKTRWFNKYNWSTEKLKSGGLAIVIKILERFRDKRDRTLNICGQNVFCIKICSGCLGNCSFCAVRLSRGKLKSKPIAIVINEFEEGLKKGYTDFALLGTETGAYGKDFDTNLVVLLKELLTRKGDYKISLRNMHPKYLIEMLPELREIFASEKISFIACSPESGNNRILDLMNRGYNIEDFKQAISILNKEFPQIKIRTQFIVGFPTETEKEFQDTMRLIDGLHFDFIEAYVFQTRKGTKAATMTGHVPEKIKQARYLRLLLKLLWKKC